RGLGTPLAGPGDEGSRDQRREQGKQSSQGPSSRRTRGRDPKRSRRKRKRPPVRAGVLFVLRVRRWSGGDRGDHLLRVAQHVAAAPDGFDVVLAFGGRGQLLAQLADEDVDDL